MSNKHLVRDSLGWGFALWFIGYALGMILYPVLAPSMIGWVILPIGVAITLWVLFRKVHGRGFRYYAIMAAAWTTIAVALDYFFIVKALHPADGYYKPDVYLYYALTLVMPLAIGWWKGEAMNEGSRGVQTGRA